MSSGNDAVPAPDGRAGGVQCLGVAGTCRMAGGRTGEVDPLVLVEVDAQHEVIMAPLGSSVGDKCSVGLRRLGLTAKMSGVCPTIGTPAIT